MPQFKPIIHNLSPDDHGYAECQLYNDLISKRPKGNGTLASKIQKLREWQSLCIDALEKAHTIVRKENNHGKQS